MFNFLFRRTPTAVPKSVAAIRAQREALLKEELADERGRVDRSETEGRLHRVVAHLRAIGLHINVARFAAPTFDGRNTRLLSLRRPDLAGSDPIRIMEGVLVAIPDVAEAFIAQGLDSFYADGSGVSVAKLAARRAARTRELRRLEIAEEVATRACEDNEHTPVARRPDAHPAVVHAFDTDLTGDTLPTAIDPQRLPALEHQLLAGSDAIDGTRLRREEARGDLQRAQARLEEVEAHQDSARNDALIAQHRASVAEHQTTYDRHHTMYDELTEAWRPLNALVTTCRKHATERGARHASTFLPPSPTAGQPQGKHS